MDRVITAETTRLWRFKTPVLEIPPGSEIDFRADGPIPVYSGPTKVGHATLDRVGNELIAEVAVDYAIPERLDVQNGKSMWLVPLMKIAASVPGVHQDTQEPCEITTVVKVVDLKFSDGPHLYVPPIGVTL